MVSTSICNECVHNINNYYIFKKRILEAQELINSPSPISQTNEHHNNDSDDEFFEDNNEEYEYEFELNGEEEEEVGDGDDEGYEIENVENNEEQPSQDAQIESGSNQESTVQPVVRSALAPNAKKRPNNSLVSSSKLSHKKTKLNTQAQTERFTLQMNECLICPAVLHDILELKDHIEAHAHIKCKACHRQFVRYSNLKRHFNSVHSKPKPFICDICGLGFNFSVNLQSHASLHYSGKLQNET